MKRIDLIRYLEKEGIQLLREGSNHSVYVNRQAGKTSTVPRHREINEFLAKKNLQRSRSPHALISVQPGPYSQVKVANADIPCCSSGSKTLQRIIVVRPILDRRHLIQN